jgi:hypothetical protein
MEVKPGRRIALSVRREWYRSVAEHKFLKNLSPVDRPTAVFTATVEDLENPTGVWVKPDERFSDFPLNALYVPWDVIETAVLLGPDGEKKIGFDTA